MDYCWRGLTKKATWCLQLESKAGSRLLSFSVLTGYYVMPTASTGGSASLRGCLSSCRVLKEGKQLRLKLGLIVWILPSLSLLVTLPKLKPNLPLASVWVPQSGWLDQTKYPGLNGGEKWVSTMSTLVVGSWPSISKLRMTIPKNAACFVTRKASLDITAWLRRMKEQSLSP